MLGSGGALWFSPNGNKIAIASFDDREVEEFTYILYEGQYEREVALRYPKVCVWNGAYNRYLKNVFIFKSGRKNPTVVFRYIDLNDISNTWHTFTAPEKVSADHILNSVNWINDELVGAHWMNRRQNLSSYQICSTSGDRSCFEVRCSIFLLLPFLCLRI